MTGRRHLQLATDTPTPIPTPDQIADMDGDWVDPQTGQNLIYFLARFGSPLARRLLDEAADIVEARRNGVAPTARGGPNDSQRS